MQICVPVLHFRALRVFALLWKVAATVVFSPTSVSNQCGAATTARRIINTGTKWRLGVWGGRDRLRPTSPENDWGLQPVNQYHSWAHRAAYMPPPPPPPPPPLPYVLPRVAVVLPQLFQLWSGVEQGRLPGDAAASVDVWCRLASPPGPSDIVLIRPPLAPSVVACVICPLCVLASRHPHIMCLPVPLQWWCGPFSHNRDTKELGNGPQLQGSERRQRRSGATPLCCLNSVQSWLQTGSGPGGGCLRRGRTETLHTTAHLTGKEHFQWENMSSCHERKNLLSSSLCSTHAVHKLLT